MGFAHHVGRSPTYRNRARSAHKTALLFSHVRRRVTQAGQGMSARTVWARRFSMGIAALNPSYLAAGLPPAVLIDGYRYAQPIQCLLLLKDALEAEG